MRIGSAVECRSQPKDMSPQGIPFLSCYLSLCSGIYSLYHFQVIEPSNSWAFETWCSVKNDEAIIVELIEISQI